MSFSLLLNELKEVISFKSAGSLIQILPLLYLINFRPYEV